METNEILEGKRLIAEFAGLVYRNEHNYTGWYKSTTSEKFAYRIGEYDRLMYNSSWDSLMPIYLEIKNNYKNACVGFDISKDRVSISVIDLNLGKTVQTDFFYKEYGSELETLFVCIVEYIKWRNANELLK